MTVDFVYTAHMAALDRVRAINEEMERLQEEKRFALARAKRYEGSTISEAERVATATEPFQAVQLPEYGEDEEGTTIRYDGRCGHHDMTGHRD